MVLVVEKTTSPWQYSCDSGACGLKYSPASWNVMIYNANGSPIFTSDIRIVAELVQEYVISGKHNYTKRESGHDGVPVAAYGVWFKTGNENKDIKISYAIVSGVNNPSTWAKGEIVFSEEAERVITD